jgi:hypothetical protein
MLKSDWIYDRETMLLNLHKAGISLLESIMEADDFTSYDETFRFDCCRKIERLKTQVDNYEMVGGKPHIIKSISLAYRIINAGYLHFLYHIDTNHADSSKNVWFFRPRQEISEIITQYNQEGLEKKQKKKAKEKRQAKSSRDYVDYASSATYEDSI